MDTIVTWQVLLGLVVILAIFDGIMVLRVKDFSIKRLVPRTVAIFKPATVILEISHQRKSKIWVDIADHCPPELNAEETNTAFWIGYRETASTSYEIKPIARGLHSLHSTGLLVRSPFALWWRRMRIEVQDDIRVYPDFETIARYLDLLKEQRTASIGLRQLQRRGSGIEFQQLRDYRQGDAMNWIDWNASSKRRSLISREFQDERNQSLIFLLDTGRRLRSRDDAISHFDHVLNAMVMLSYIALRQGDCVGALCFGFQNRWIAPLRGVGSMKKLLNAVFDLDSGTVTSDYVAMAERFEKLHRKRAMVILLTNVRDEDYELQVALRTLRKRHFVVLANLRESSLDRLQTDDIHTFEEALGAVGAINFLRERKLFQRTCAQDCNLVLDSVPPELHINLTNAYWAIKRAGSL